MKDLAKWQFISFISRGLAVCLGLVQSFVIIRILSQGEWGLVQLAISIGGALGIYQHLGLASASTREISAAKDDTQIFKIFITSIFIRYLVTLPIVFGLFFGANYIAGGLYKHPELIVPLKIYAIMLLFQGVQSILNSVIMGTKRFKNLFIYQVAIAFVSVLLFIPFVYKFRVNGYFYAMFIFTLIGIVSQAIIAFKPLKGKLVFPDRRDFVPILKDIFSISIAIYVVKVLYTNWEKFGNNALGLFNTAETVAIFGFAVLYSKKLLQISDAVTDVNLPVLSEKYVRDFDDFKKVFIHNFNRVFSVICLTAAFAGFWAPEIIKVLAGVQKYNEYFESLSLIPPLMVAFVMYSVLDILKSSVLIPAKMSKEMVTGFVILLLGTITFFYVGYRFIGVLPAMAWGMAYGSLASLWYVNLTSKKKLNFTTFTLDHGMILLQVFFITWFSSVDTLWVKVVAFLPIFTFLLWGIFICKFLTKEEIFEMHLKIKNKLNFRHVDEETL